MLDADQKDIASVPGMMLSGNTTVIHLQQNRDLNHHCIPSMQDVLVRDGKQLALYSKLLAMEKRPQAIVVPAECTLHPYSRTVHASSSFTEGRPTHGDEPAVALAEGDRPFSEWRGRGLAQQEPRVGPGDSIINVLFSSGTTGEPKAIPWTQITPLRYGSWGCASLMRRCMVPQV